MLSTLKTISQGKGLIEKFGYEHLYPYFKSTSKQKLRDLILNKNAGKYDYLNTKLYEATFETILPTLLRNYDRYSMINGVEIRMPFLDYRIIEFAFSIPSSSKIRNGFSKSIVRDAMKGFFPDEVRLLKRKTGFNSPFTEWLKGPLKEWVYDEINSNDFKTASFINQEEVTNKIHRTINSDFSTFADGEEAWSLLMPYVWEKSLVYAK
jgi:asparagine synthase (glutamine-hydrolysing)